MADGADAPHPFSGRKSRMTADTVGVIGKKFPTNRFADFLSRYPTAMMVFFSILPIAFMFIAIGSNVAVDVSLSGFQADPHESTTSSALIDTAVKQWLLLVSGAQNLTAQLDLTKPKSKVLYRQEVRFDVSLPDFSTWYYDTYLKSTTFPQGFAATSNLLSESNVQFVQLIEREIQALADYNSICFTNNLKFGRKQTTTPQCAPLVSLTQNFFPGTYTTRVANSTVYLDWELTGQGAYYQLPYKNVISRVLANANYRWFVDKRFSNLYPYTRSLRFQITLASPIAPNSASSFQQTVRTFVGLVEAKLQKLSSTHPFIYLSYGGDQVEETKLDKELNAEYYKLLVMIGVVAVVVFAHTRTAIMTICVIIQLLLIYLAAWGFYVTAYSSKQSQTTISTSGAEAARALPLLSSISLFIIISFCLHGTLTFYDMFVHSGIMATTGRRNNLSVSQRIAFTMRRASTGITIANGIAIIVFAVNSSSAFQAVRDFSVMMIFALLFNVYYAWTVMPAYVLWHHYYFSRKKRYAQKRREIMNDRSDRVERHPVMCALLADIQSYLRPGYETYAAMAERVTTLNLLQETRLEQFFNAGAAPLLTDVRRDLDEIIATLSKRNDPSRPAEGGADAARDAGHDFQFEMFVDVNELNVVAADSYLNPQRLIHHDHIVHVPLHSTLRSAENISTTSMIALEIQGPNEQDEVTPMPKLRLGNSDSRRKRQVGILHDNNKMLVVGGAQGELSNEGPGQETAAAALGLKTPTNQKTHAALGVHRKSKQHFEGDNFLATAQVDGSLPEQRASADDTASVGSAAIKSPDAVDTIDSGTGSDVRRKKPPIPKGHPVVRPPPSDPKDEDVHSFFTHWGDAAERLMIARGIQRASTNTEGEAASYANSLMAFLGFQWCSSHDPYWTVSEIHSEGISSSPLLIHHASLRGNPIREFPPEEGETPASARKRRRKEESDSPSRAANATLIERRQKATEEYTNFFSRLRNRWETRETHRREFCCGMLGKRVNESREERDARILARSTKQEGYGVLERFLVHTAAPTIDRTRFPLVALFVALLVTTIVVASREKGGGVPNTLLADVSQATAYVRMSTLFAQSGSCDFCGLYYMSPTTPRSATERDLALCQAHGYPNQMNLYADSCGVCGGQDECVRCDGTTNANMSVRSCGVCSDSEAVCGFCLSTASCTYCDMHGLGGTGTGGVGCATTCSCMDGRGSCNPFTGLCDCKGNTTFGFGGDDCSGCADGWLEAGCSYECTSVLTSPQCNCVKNKCMSCPSNTRGYLCESPKFVCINGVSTALGCQCDSGWGGERCDVHQNCTFRGSWYTLSNAPFVGCGCKGNWMGPSCNFCACRNGGYCTADGTCVCSGAFIGPQCQYCGANCSYHGTCPLPIEAALMDLRSCVASACSSAEIAADTVCQACANIQWGLTEECFALTTPLACNQNISCFWLGSRCVFTGNPQRAMIPSKTKCSCRGAWAGALCDNCTGPVGSRCTPRGDVIACDGLTYVGGVGAPSMDICGVCGGTGNCIGCDGVALSGKVYDDCGVCGGGNLCLGAASSSPVAVTFFFDVSAETSPAEVSPYIKDALVLQLQQACLTITRLSTQGVLLPTAKSCVMSDYIIWQQSGAGRALTGGSSFTTSGLLLFVTGAGRLGEVGFTTNMYNSSQLQLKFMTIAMNTPTLTTAGNEAIYSQYTKMISVVDQLRSLFDVGGLSGVSVRQTSLMWANAVAAHVAFTSLKFTGGVGLAVMFGVVAAAFGSIRMALFATLGAVLTLCGTLAAAATQGWDLDAVMQICVAGVIAIAAEHLVHLVDGYQDFLQSSQSHMFAVATTKMNAVRGALTRTGVSIISSTVAVIAVSSMFVASNIQPFRRAAQVIITVHVMTFLAAILFGAKLCAAGPLRLYRHWAVSTVLCCVCVAAGGIAVLIIYLAHGVEGPSGYRVP